MPLIPITLACGDYDRTRALREGSIQPDGISLTCLQFPVEEIFFRMVRFQEFDAAELSLSSYLLSLDDDARGRFVAIPVFLSRSFRHGGIYVNTASGVQRPEDLVGCTVGIPEYQVTAAVWIRGILAEYHGVAIDSVEYKTGGLHQPGRTEKIKLDLKDSVSISPIGPGQTLSEMLRCGEIDALYSPRAPRSFDESPHRVRRLFGNARSQAERYFRETRIFPIMHIVVIRRDIYERHRWIARSLQSAFEKARARALSALDDTTSLRYMVPWLVEEVENTRSIMGYDYWTYGLDADNVRAIETLARYSHEQNLTPRPYRATEIFAPEAVESVVI